MTRASFTTNQPDPGVQMPTVVLIGADGMLGRAMAAQLNAREWRCIAPTLAELDLASPESIRRFPWPAPETAWHIINCAAWTDVDGAESHETEATAINAAAVGELAAACTGGMLVTYSTDYVFDGKASAPYRADHPRGPLSAYGRSKARGEEILERSGGNWLNIRTSWLHAPWGRNFVRTMATLMRERPQLRVVNDQRGRPTSAEHLARCSLALLDRGMTGHWHVTDGGECTWYDFALEIKRLTGAPAEVLPCTTAEFPRPAPRPAYSVLDLSRTEEVLGSMPHWKQNLADIVSRLES
jgi:dTDP-4-dehydrorhamnose reductase